jgi:hypothetical protein
MASRLRERPQVKRLREETSRRVTQIDKASPAGLSVPGTLTDPGRDGGRGSCPRRQQALHQASQRDLRQTDLNAPQAA